MIALRSYLAFWKGEKEPIGVFAASSFAAQEQALLVLQRRGHRRAKRQDITIVLQDRAVAPASL